MKSIVNLLQYSVVWPMVSAGYLTLCWTYRLTELIWALSEQISFVHGDFGSVKLHDSLFRVKSAKERELSFWWGTHKGLALEPSDGKQQEMFNTHRAARPWVHSQVSWQHPQSGQSWATTAATQLHESLFRWYLPEPWSLGEFCPCKRRYLMFSVNTWAWISTAERKEANQIKTGRTYPMGTLGTWEGSSY